MPSNRSREASGNIAQLLLQRETGGLRGRNIGVGQTPSETGRLLGCWTENDFMQHCSGQYVEFKPVPRSTIAASFSPNGALLASTHGDHTVKIVDCFAGSCRKVLEGHTRTPWVVRFHPIDSDILASGSLDHRVVVWRVSTGEKMHVHDFGKPIASIAFHPSGKALVVASGHKVYFWDYMKPSSTSRSNPNPSYILRTKRSLRALHFHPLGLPLILTAEVVDSKKSQAPAGTAGADARAAHHPAAAAMDLGLSPPQAMPTAATTAAAAAQAALAQPTGAAAVASTSSGSGHLGFLGTALSDVAMRVLDLAGMRLPGPLHAVARALMQNPRGLRNSQRPVEVPNTRELASQALLASFRNHPTMWTPDARTSSPWDWARYQQQHMQQQQRQVLRHNSPGGASTGDLTAVGSMNEPVGAQRARQQQHQQQQPPPPPLQQQQGGGDPMDAVAARQIAAVATAAAAALSAMERLRLGGHDAGPSGVGAGASAASAPYGGPSIDLAMCDPWGMQRIRSVGGTETHAFPLEPQPLGAPFDLSWGWQASSPGSSTESAQTAQRHNALLENELMPLAMTSEQPCVVNLNVWSFNHRRPSSTLDKPRLSVPRAVLCSEMGAQFSPCGKYLALCVAVDTPSEAGRAWLAEHVRASKQRMAVAEAVRDSAVGRYSSGAGSSRSGAGQWWSHQSEGSHQGHAQAGGSRSDAFTHGGFAPPYAASPSGAGRPSIATAAVGSSSQAGTSSDTFSWPYTPTQYRPSPTGFMVPMAEAWEVFPREVPWLEFRSGTPESAVREAVAKAREAEWLTKPLYELRIYSLDGRSFGQILQARLIRAAHCLTSVQFSPTSEHLLVAYGRRYISLCNLVAEGEGRSLVPAHTIIEVYDTKTLQLVRALPSLDDEVNVATFHPVPGAGIVYGTKEGRLRMLRYDKRNPRRPCIAVATGGGRLDEELAAAERDVSNSDEDGEMSPDQQQQPGQRA